MKTEKEIRQKAKDVIDKSPGGPFKDGFMRALFWVLELELPDIAGLQVPAEVYKEVKK